MKLNNLGLYKTEKKYYNQKSFTYLINYFLFKNDNLVSRSIIEGWQYHKYFFDFLELNEIELSGKTIIDVGANNGSFTIDFSKLVGEAGKVYSFEPQRIIYMQLCTNCFINGCTNVFPINKAVGEKNEIIDIEVNDFDTNAPVNYGNTHVVINNNTDKKTEAIECITIDSLNLKNVALVKIDIQGFELFALKGMLNTLKENRPYLFIEIEKEQIDFFDYKKDDIFGLMVNQGYSYKKFLTKEDENIVSDYLFYPNEKKPYYIP